ncbi:MAG: hypothetical protein A2119_00400 [Candidatus Colwellbacteria bacterium GWA2_46_10]|uniref:Uncharacterized protein n=1 Tax=Candidatus Colwellbacteria bacterium GWA2_46_10 TaxID=1797684 RepID=A0A1G1YVA3_9BACT|nr:MAG: internalization-related competence protein ComEC/Rec2 protein [Parcubacteria group bacterium GW2011_GWA2_46_10]OGY56244.1 MAG: hypothetical protein A2119_00400 [Candidatus Colwellbacteria bacterium GWA2_46_10]
MPLHDKAFYLALFFIIGTVAAGFGINVWWALLGAFLISKVVFSMSAKKALVFTAICFFGFFYLHLYDVLHKDIIPLGESQHFEGTIVEEPEEGIQSTRVTVKLDSQYRGKVWLYTSPGNTLEYGDIIAFEGSIEVSPGGVNIASFPGGLGVVGKDGGNSVRGALIKFKGALIGKLEAVLPAEHAALASGLLLGERAEFTDEFEEAMRRSGTTHIVALSGYNIAILVLVISGIFSYIWNRRVAFYLSLLIIPGFVVMTGAAPSVVRAGIMGLILLLAENQSRPYSPRNAITLTALGMIFFNPRVGVDDVGFQLSFAALLGIIYLYPFLGKKFKVQSEGFLSWKKNALQTASAQIAVLPIILFTFGFFSPVALISNVLILEFIPITMLFSFVTTILGFVSFHLSLIMGWISSVFLGYEIFIIKFFGLSWL